MAPSTFVQESRLGRWIFQIREGSLHLSIPRFGHGFDEYHVNLGQVDPNYRALTMRLNFRLALMGGLFVLSCLAVWGAHQQKLIPHEALSYFLHWPYLGIGVSFVLAIQYSRRVEFFQFYDHWGKPLFIVVRERPQAAECEAFVLTLVSHIELAQSELPNTERERLLRQMARDLAPLPQVESKVAFWKLSLVLGCVAVGLPWIPGLAYYLDLFHFMVIFGLCVGGATSSVFSYINKERHRHWSALGLVLSLIPPFIY